MADPIIWQIESGVLAFSVVDTGEVGYLPTWNAPAGKTAETAAIADYEAESDSWSCQVTVECCLHPADTTTTDVAATFCAPARVIPTPGETSYTLDVEFLQDPNVATGPLPIPVRARHRRGVLCSGLNGALPPKAVGRVRLQAGAFGGAARTTR